MAETCLRQTSAKRTNARTLEEIRQLKKLDRWSKVQADAPHPSSKAAATTPKVRPFGQRLNIQPMNLARI